MWEHFVNYKMLLFSSENNLVFTGSCARPLGIEKENDSIDFILHLASIY